MKKLFQAIRQGNTAAVRELLEKKPELISCTAKQPPKKDDGQSPLQVALKTNRLEIAEYLLDLGADVNFMEAENCASGWRAPVLHDAVNAAVMNSRWSVNSQAMYGGIKVFHTREEADRAYLILKRMLDLGADIRGVDSYGNSCVAGLPAGETDPARIQSHHPHIGNRPHPDPRAARGPDADIHLAL